MKKIIIPAISLAALLLTGACSIDERTSGNNGNEAMLTLNMGLDGAVQTRAIGDGSGADLLIYAVFDSTGTRIDGIEQVSKNVTFPTTETITLAKGQTYRIAFWAQNRACTAYEVSDEMVVTINYEGALGNDETRDAFFKTVEVTVTGDAELDVELTRPFAQINVGVTTEDWNTAMAAGIAITESKAVVNQAARTLNLLDGTVADPVDVTFDFANIPTDALSVDLDGDGTPETYKYLSMNYILPNDETTGDASTTLSDLEFTFHPEAGNDITLTQGLDAVPVQRNWRTNIIGRILSGNLDINISIDPDFNDDHNVDAPVSETVSDAARLAALLTSDEKQIVVTLDGDIDLPISDLGEQTPGSGEYKLGGENTESIVIDLNGHTLNLTTSYMSKLGAKNDEAVFTIQNGTMTSSTTDGTWNIYDLTFANCNYKIEDVVFEKSIAFTNDNRTVTMNGVTINEQNGDYYAMWISAVGQNITIDDLTLTSTGRGIKIDEEYVNNPAKVTLNISNSKFTTVYKAAIMVDSKEGAEINVTNVDIANVAADPVFTVWIDEDAKDFADNVIVNGAKVRTEGSNEVIVATSNEELAAATIADNATIYLTKGEYVIPASAKGKTVTFVGTGNPEDVEVAVTKVGEGGENCDFGLDGSNATFEGITITTNSSTYIGYARCNGTYKNCIINGTYTLYGESIFDNCEFNVSGNVYNIWTWGAEKIKFTGCTFNSDGKALLLYREAGGTVNLIVTDCTFNDKGGLVDAMKAAIEIGDSPLEDKPTYNVTVSNTTVNGYAINDEGESTGTNIWGNKNSMPDERLNVTIDEVNVY